MKFWNVPFTVLALKREAQRLIEACDTVDNILRTAQGRN